MREFKRKRIIFLERVSVRKKEEVVMAVDIEVIILIRSLRLRVIKNIISIKF